MRSLSGAVRPLALIAASLSLAIIPAAVPAQTVAEPIVAAADIQPPQGLQPDDPWIYRGTDIPVDTEWLMGELDNGLRYAVRNNGVPPGQVSIRVRIDAGALHEEDDQMGFAHLLEHMTFRESKYLQYGQAIPTWQRLGATFGSDTNAATTPTMTVYQLDLPSIRGTTLNESFRLLSGMIREPVINKTNVDAEVPIVLAELRESNGAGRRVADESLKIYFDGQRLAERPVAGNSASLQAATPERVQAFHDKWYRPDKTVVVAVGDFDPVRMAGMIEHYFADWGNPATPAIDPDFGQPQMPDGADPENPVGKVGVLIEPDLARGISYATFRPYVQVTDNIEYNRGILLDAIALAIVNRRLEAKARAGGSFLFAAVDTNKVSRSAEGTYVNVTPIGEDWESALQDVRAVIADAIAEPPTEEEIARELADYEVFFTNQVEQSEIQAGSDLADSIVNAVDIREAVAAPEVVFEVFHGMRDRFSPEAVHEATKRQFEGVVTRGMMVLSDPSEGNEEALRTAMLAPVEADGSSRLVAQSITFDDLPPIGEEGELVGIGGLGLLDMKRLDFANGVRAITWRTTNEPGRATVRVRFGAGYRAFEPEDAPYIQLGRIALASSGIGPLGQEELDRLSSGRKLGLMFDVEEGTFVLEGETRPADVPDQLYLLAAKLAMPRWDPNPVVRAQALLKLTYETYSSDPGGVLRRDLTWLLHNRDQRYTAPTPTQIDQTTPEGFREVWEPILSQGPVEVMVFGDFNEAEVVEALFETFGALEPREPAPDSVLMREPQFPIAQDMPTVMHHRGDADQGAAIVAWPTGGGSGGLPESRKLEVLSQLFSNRILDEMRERSGASYAPQVFSTWPVDVETGGYVLAQAQLPPETIPTFFEVADTIAQDLAANGPSDDELARVTEPLSQMVQRALTGHQFWMSQIEGATFDPQRVDMMRSILSDYSVVSADEMKLLAAKYLVPAVGFRLAIIPEGQQLVQNAPARDTAGVAGTLQMAD